jgi:hypothetical protein
MSPDDQGEELTVEEESARLRAKVAQVEEAVQTLREQGTDGKE